MIVRQRYYIVKYAIILHIICQNVLARSRTYNYEYDPPVDDYEVNYFYEVPNNVERSKCEGVVCRREPCRRPVEYQGPHGPEEFYFVEERDIRRNPSKKPFSYCKNFVGPSFPKNFDVPPSPARHGPPLCVFDDVDFC